MQKDLANKQNVLEKGLPDMSGGAAGKKISKMMVRVNRQTEEDVDALELTNEK